MSLKLLNNVTTSTFRGGCIFNFVSNPANKANMTNNHIFRYSFVVALLVSPCCFFPLPSDRKEQLWMDLKAGAESGWDFTSRWYIDGDGHNNGTLRDTRTSQILPADLNALLCLSEKTLASFHRILGEYTSSL